MVTKRLSTKKVVIKDVVAYENLTPGKEHKVTGILMDKETNEPLLVDGEPGYPARLYLSRKLPMAAQKLNSFLMPLACMGRNWLFLKRFWMRMERFLQSIRKSKMKVKPWKFGSLR